MLAIIGIDCASQIRNMGASVAEVDDNRIRSVRQISFKDDESLISEIGFIYRQYGKALLALDSPLGWPTRFSEAVFAHRAGRSLGAGKEQFFSRLTDVFISKTFKKYPLYITADKISFCAFSALRLLERIALQIDSDLETIVSRSHLGSLSAIEVYPAATLISHGLYQKKYKEDASKMEAIIASIQERLAIEKVEWRGLNDHVFDSMVCCLAGFDFLQGNVYYPEEADVALLKKEGWIWVKRKEISHVH